MNLILSYILFIIIPCFAIWNIFTILWKLLNKYSKTWHFWGLVIRFELAVLIVWLMLFPPEYYFTWQLFFFWALVFINVSWSYYDFIINWIWCKYGDLHTIWYIDDKGINAFFLKHLKRNGTWIFRGLLIIANILILVL
jgi:hypothetical protein